MPAVLSYSISIFGTLSTASQEDANFHPNRKREEHVKTPSWMGGFHLRGSNIRVLGRLE
jgi:hypothetical protein